jgi:vesicular inhibitory amino acid transporter
MFGEGVRDEVTSNILKSNSYPHALSILIVVLIAIIPITKIPLSNRPMMDTINKKFYIDLRQMDAKARKRSEKSWKHRGGRAAIGILANITQLGISTGFPDFDSIMALMGSAFCFTVCVILPLSFHLKIFGKEIPTWELTVDWFLLVVCAALAVLGTVWAILPKEKIGIEQIGLHIA